MHRSLILAFAFLAAGCAQGTRVVTTSSSNQATYAVGYADDVAALTKAIADRRAEVHEFSAKANGRIDELKKPNMELVLSIVMRSDEAGRSAGFLEGYTDARATREFWTEERESIGNHVGGSVQYAAKKGGCSPDAVGGAATHALRESMDKKIDQRARAHNDASILIDRNRTALGKENAVILEKLADDVARARFIVQIELVQLSETLKKKLADKDAVGPTIDRYLTEERAWRAEKGRTEAEKKASDERIASAEQNQSALSKTCEKANAALKTINEDIESERKAHDEAFAALRAKLSPKK